MRRPPRHGLFGAALVAQALVIVGLLAVPGRGQEAKSVTPSPEQVVQGQVDAYNRHDIEAFLKTYAPEIKLYEFPDKELSSGLAVMREKYGKLFESEPDRKVVIAKRIIQGDCVIDHED